MTVTKETNCKTVNLKLDQTIHTLNYYTELARGCITGCICSTICYIVLSPCKLASVWSVCNK